MMKFFLKADKLAAWILFFCMIFYGVSGYAMVKGLFSPVLANQLHMHWLGPVALLAFVFHTSFAIHLAFRRWKIWNKATLVLLVIFYLSLAGFLVYLDSFYQPSYQKTSPKPIAEKASASASVEREDDEDDDRVRLNKPAVVDSNSSSQSPVAATSGQDKVFTVDELAKYDGRNGQPAYVAVDGLVYDMSSVFRGGYHAGYPAGKDWSPVFHGKHDQSYLNGYTIVGKLK